MDTVHIGQRLAKGPLPFGRWRRAAMTDKNITKDAMYDAVAPNDFE